jgi:anti-anti-sigma factor
MLELTYRAEQTLLTCTFAGRMDGPNSPEADALVKAKLAEIGDGATVVFDLGGVGYVSSAFLRVIIGAAKAVDEAKFSVVNCQPFIKRLFVDAGLDRLFSVS